MLLFLLLNPTDSPVQTGYAIGLVIAVILLIYLLYALIKPEKF